MRQIVMQNTVASSTFRVTLLILNLTYVNLRYIEGVKLSLASPSCSLVVV